MSYWNGKAPSASNLRLFDPRRGWLAYDDAQDAQKKTTDFGSSRAMELALHAALNASNLLVLTGAGTSYCATTNGGLRAPSMVDLWDAVESAVTTQKLDEIIALIPTAANLNKNIEKLLTLSKLYGALFADPNSERVAEFVKRAEKAIVDRSDFVNDHAGRSTGQYCPARLPSSGQHWTIAPPRTVPLMPAMNYPERRVRW